MQKDSKAVVPPAPAPPSAPPSHVILTADFGAYRAGRVLAADADLLAQLDAAHASYRTATARERNIGGFPA